ncbi:MAG TPA: pseudouridine synthase [Longimicrobiales bacterium]|nr:pseudouridine synthase [Longimicrobiales bacterium]
MSADASVRLQKFLSQAGVASRRAAEQLMVSGRVRVNGKPATEPGIKVDPDRDVVEVDGRRVRPAAPLWIALHKPRGYVTTRSDPQGRSTVYELLPAEHRRLFHVGRLDYDSEGLLLLTNDGDTAERLQHPRYEVDRVYNVDVVEPLTDVARRALLAGVTLEDGRARVRGLRRLRGQETGAERWAVTMREGRKREVRRLFDAVGSPVRRLRRVRYGPIELGTLRPGAWRKLTSQEVRALRAR